MYMRIDIQYRVYRRHVLGGFIIVRFFFWFDNKVMMQTEGSNESGIHVQLRLVYQVRHQAPRIAYQ